MQINGEGNGVAEGPVIPTSSQTAAVSPFPPYPALKTLLQGGIWGRTAALERRDPGTLGG